MASWKVAISTAACAAAAGCQSYTARPLDDEAHMIEWQSRRGESDEVRAFAASLDHEVDMPVFDVADGISLHEAQVVALAYNPDLREARARAAVALAGAETAGLWDDPVLDVDVMHVIENVPNPWVIGTAIGFTLPLSGRLGVEKSLAGAEHNLALREVIQQEWSVATDLRETWLAWSAARLQADLNAQLIERIDAIVRIVDRLEAAGEMSRLESRLFRLEGASRDVERIRLDAEARRLDIEIRALMGLLPEAPVILEPTVILDGIAPIESHPGDRTQLAKRNPALAMSRAAYDAAEHALRLEIRKQYPDVTLGPAFERDEDQSKIGFIFGMPIPILNANRRGIAEASARRDQARIAYEREFEHLVSALSQAELEWRAATEAREQIERILVPLADEQLADQQRLADLGELDTLLTLETVVRAQETKVQLIEARLAEAQSLNRIAELIGPDVPHEEGNDGAQQ